MSEDQHVTQEADGIYGVELMSWEVDEFPRYDRGAMWYGAMIGGGAALLIYAVISANFLFALIILMFGLILYLSSVRRPRRIRFTIGDLGIGFGDVAFPYAEVGGFWFVYEPPQVKDLHIEFRSRIRGMLTVDLEGQNPNIVREVLGNYILEDLTKDEEPLSHVLSRLLKI